VVKLGLKSKKEAYLKIVFELDLIAYLDYLTVCTTSPISVIQVPLVSAY
jgi:hypothetical protein